MKRTFEDIKAIADRYEYLNDFRTEEWLAFVYAQRHKWLDRLGLKKKRVDNGHYTYDVCRDIATGCKTRTEFYQRSKMAYRTALRNGWLDGFTWLRKPCPRHKRGFWTLERTKYALKVCCCYKELNERFAGARKAAQRYGIYDLLYESEKPVRMTDRDRSLIAAIGSRDEREMREYFPEEHASAKKKGWIEDYKDFWK